MTVPRPDFLVVGNPRSGTTWLDHVLRGHPAIHMGLKELHYFGSDLDFDQPKRSLASYRRHLAGARPGQIVGESSVWYLHSDVADREAAGMNPDLRIVISLRDPANWLRSLHAMLVLYCEEGEPDFETALGLSDQRLQRGSGPSHEPPYLHLVRYADQVLRWQERFGRTHVKVEFFEELMTDRRARIAEVFHFLGVAPDYEGLGAALAGTRGSRNANRTPRSRTLQGLLTSAPAKRILRRHETAPPGLLLGLRALRRLNHRVVQRTPFDQRLRADLVSRFAPEMDRLEELLGRPVPKTWRASGLP